VPYGAFSVGRPTPTKKGKRGGGREAKYPWERPDPLTAAYQRRHGRCKEEGASCDPLRGSANTVVVYYSLEGRGKAQLLVTLERGRQERARPSSVCSACSAYGDAPTCRRADIALRDETCVV
jgi:hypothetical protein